MDKEKPFQHQKQQKLEQTYNNGFEIVTKHPLLVLCPIHNSKGFSGPLLIGAKTPEIRNAKIGITLDTIRNAQKKSYS